MITASLAIWILLGMTIVLALVIPLLDSVERLSKFISLRWTCIAIILLIMVGVIIDFDHLADNTRDIVLKGGLIIVGLYLVLRTVEKVLYNGWLKGVNLKGTVTKGDTTASVEIKQDKDPKIEIKEEKKEDSKEESQIEE
jgi:hypothetical protein